MAEHASGWYEHDGERRYWDGQRWTHATSGPPVPFASTPPHGFPPPPGAPVAAPRKEPWIAVLASFLLPGLGSIINGDTGVGATLMIIHVLSLVFLLCFWVVAIGFIGIPVMMLVWVGGMVHAHQGAVDFNRRAGHPG